MKLTKSFKKSVSLILSAILILSLFSVAAVSASAVSSGDIIYFEKPDSWSDNIYIYYWEGSPKPSGLQDYKMESVGGNIYKYTAKASFSEFLFNDGTHQTVNVTLPASGKMCRVLSTGRNNDWGNFCNDATWVDFEQQSIGLSVGASPKNCDFVGSIEVASLIAIINNPTQGCFQCGSFLAVCGLVVFTRIVGPLSKSKGCRKHQKCCNHHEWSIPFHKLCCFKFVL